MPKRVEPEPRRITVVRYQTPEGRRCTAGTPGAVKVKTLSDAYYLHLPPRTPGGKRQRIPLETADLAVAWVRLRDHLQRLKEEELGILDDTGRQAARPIAEHLSEWLSAVAAGGVGSERVKHLRGRMERLIVLANWSRIGDVKKSSLAGALQALQAGAIRGKGSAGRDRGASAQTRNHYLSHARQFTRWLRDEGRLAVDPLAGLKPVSVEADRRHDRRIPDELEVRVFFDHLDGRQATPAQTLRGMSGPQRALGYQVAMCAGLRAGELRRLTAASFDLVGGEVRISAASDKARKRRRMALPGWLVEKVAAWLAGGGRLWDGFPARDPGREVLARDLAAARAGWIAETAGDEAEMDRREASSVLVCEIQTEDGPKYFDMHSFRHWYITQVAGMQGISPSTLQALSRHADPRLTLETYGRAKTGQVRDAVEQLPRLSE